MKRIAVLGSGISGLAAAYFLSRKHEVHLLERDARLGGHTHTVTVESSQGPLGLDTGFLVHNDRSYPNLERLFRELDAAGLRLLTYYIQRIPGAEAGCRKVFEFARKLVGAAARQDK